MNKNKLENKNNKKRILLVTFSDNSDHQDTLFGLYEELIKTEDVYLLCIKEPKVPLKKTKNTWLVDCPKRPGITKKTLDLITLNKIIKKIKKNKFDIVYFESLHVWNIPIMIACRKKSTIFHVIHDVIPHENDKQAKLVHIMNKAITKLADYIILRNKKYISTLSETYKVSKNRIIFLELWRRFPEYTKPTYSKKVLFFGRINPYKGANNLLEITKLCPNVDFIVEGRVDDSVKDIKDELIKRKNVTIIDEYVTDEMMKKTFKECDWVIVPYNSATQSGVIIDAYKYSRPVVAYDVGAIQEQIVNEKTGFLINPSDNKQFSDKINELHNINKDMLNIFCKNSYEYGQKKYGVQKAYNSFLQIIAENEKTR